MKSKWVLLIIILFIILRLPSLFEPYWHGDEGITLTVGQTIADGAVLYKDITDNKTPLLYIAAAFSQTLFIFKLLTLFIALGCLTVFIKLNTFFVTKNSLLSICIFTVLIATPLIEANIVNGELYMMLPTLIGVLLFFHKKYVASGIAFGIALLCKQPALFDFIAVILYSLLILRFEIKRIVYLLAGFFIPITLSILYFWFKGGLFEYIQEAYVNTFLYSETWRLLMDPKVFLLTKSILLVVFISILVIRNRTHKDSVNRIFLLFWLVFALFGATITNRPYLHYLLQISAPLSFVIGTVLVTLRMKSKKLIGSFSLLIGVVLLFLIIQFWVIFGQIGYVFAYYTQFTNQEFFDKEVLVTNELSDFIHSLKNNAKVFIWSDNSLIYAKSKKHPPFRYVSAYHVWGNSERENELINSLHNNLPDYIIITLPKKYDFRLLHDLISLEYTKVKETKDYVIYRQKYENYIFENIF